MNVMSTQDTGHPPPILYRKSQSVAGPRQILGRSESYSARSFLRAVSLKIAYYIRHILDILII